MSATCLSKGLRYGGKSKNGGFSVSAIDRTFIKETKTYRARLRGLAHMAQFWRETTIENLPFDECIRLYGKRPYIVLYCDPPYFGTESYYAERFERWEHMFLAEQLNACKAQAVVSYYHFDVIEELYPPDRWEYREIESTKNSISGARFKRTQTELLLIKRAGKEIKR